MSFNKIWFKYTVQDGDSSGDLEYLSSNSLILSSSNIVDYDGGITTLTLPNPTAIGSLSYNKNIIIDASFGSLSGDIIFGSISTECVGTVRSPQEQVFEECEILTTDYFHFLADSSYNNEVELYRSLICENFNIYGADCLYYITTFDTSYDKLFGEDDNRRVIRKFPVKVSFELPRELESYSKFGIEGMDNFIMYMSKNHFESASKLHIDAKLFPQVSNSLKNVNEIQRPNVGDIIFSQYNNMYFEVLDVGEEDEMFLQRKHTWTLKVRIAKNEHLTLDTENSSHMQDIEDDLISREDITRINNYISSADDSVFYTSSTGETPTNLNSLNGW